MKKKYRLRKWVKLILYIVITFSLLVLVCECDSLKIMVLKTIITAPVLLVSGILLNEYGG